MNEQLKEKIISLVKSKKIFLFMKGSPDAPQCGFSAQVVDVLRKNNAEFGSFDVLSDESVREGVKEYSNWPTIPQIFINQKFIGGCDILCQLDESGELKKLISAQ